MSAYSGATPIGQLRPMQPRNNDPMIMNEIMDEIDEPKGKKESFGTFDQNEIFNLLKEPVVIMLLFLLVTSSFANDLIGQHLYNYMQYELFIKAVVIGMLFFVVKISKILN